MDEIKERIKSTLLDLREDEAEEEILNLCERNCIKGDKKKIINKFYKAEKKAREDKLKEQKAESSLREAYSTFITATDPYEQYEQIKAHLLSDWITVKETDAQMFIRQISSAFGFDAELKKMLRDFFKSEKAEYNRKKLEGQKQKNNEIDSEYINDEIRDWKDYSIPLVEKGYYELDRNGVYREIESFNETTGQTTLKRIDVCRTPFVLCGISEPLNGSDIFYKVRFLTYDGEIKEFWASQSDLLSKKELKTLFLAKGINCPENALLSETVEYISLSIGEFGSKFKKEFSAKRNGWNDDHTIFVLGDRAITKDSIFPVLTVGNSKGFPELEKKGTLEGWKQIAPFLEYELIRFKFYDAFTAPINTLLGMESHITDHWGNSACGKTFSSWVVLSGVGDPEGLTIGAKSTAKGILIWIRDFSDLPVLIDESSDAGEHLQDIIYPLTSNKGRVKSTQSGERDGGEEYHTSTMMTGEKPIRDCLTNSGQQYRVNELDDTLPDMQTKEIENVKRIIRENHGHIIELYIKKVIEWHESGALQITYDNCFEALPENVSNIEGRSRSIFAGIMTAGRILEKVFKEVGLPYKNAEPIVNKYFTKCILENPVELEYIRALRVTLDWVHSESGKFAGYDPEYDYLSVTDKNKRYGYVDPDFIDIIGTEFTKKIKEVGFSPSKIKLDWWNHGIVESNDKKHKGSHVCTRPDRQFNGVRIRRQVAEDLLGINYHPVKIEEDQQEKIMVILQIIHFLSKINGNAKVHVIRAIKNIPDLDGLLDILSKNGKILKLDQTTYKSV
jgi:uncharacterized protein (DUF927 family)